MNKTFVMGDIHGNYKGLLQVLERSNFNYDEDILIQLGDVADGWAGVYDCVEELCKIRHLIAIRGNHDQWFLDWLRGNSHGSLWSQGGWGTYNSYVNKLGIERDLDVTDIPLLHKEFFTNIQKGYHFDKERNALFVHAGFDRHKDFYTQPAFIWMWDRDLWGSAMSYGSIDNASKTQYKFKNFNGFQEIFIGHTTTNMWEIDTPMHAANIWNLDTGSGFSGKLTIMDVDSKEYWQSDNVKLLYPNEKGR